MISGEELAGRTKQLLNKDRGLAVGIDGALDGNEVALPSATVKLPTHCRLPAALGGRTLVSRQGLRVSDLRLETSTEAG